MLYQLFIQTLQNPEKVKTFIRILDWAFYKLFWPIVLILVSIKIAILIYQVYKKTKWKVNKDTKSEQITPILIKDISQRQKKLNHSLVYLIIGEFLQLFNWKLVDFWFSLFSHNNATENIGIKIHNPEINTILTNWSILSFLIFSFAPFFIAFCFGNKFIRNLWILIYVFGILFIGLGYFLNLWLYA